MLTIIKKGKMSSRIEVTGKKPEPMTVAFLSEKDPDG